MKMLPWRCNTSYRVPVAVGAEVLDCSCGMPRPVRVLELFDWGLRVRSIVAGFPEHFDCTRWAAIQEAGA